MNKIEKLRKILNKSCCQDCNDFGLCEYCEPKQTLVDIENVLAVFEYLLISNRTNGEYERKVNKAIEAYKRLTTNESTIEDETDVEPEPVKCPYCGESYYTIKSTISTLIAHEPIYSDGKLISSDPNTYTTHCHCLKCKKDFNIIQNSNGIKVVED